MPTNAVTLESMQDSGALAPEMSGEIFKRVREKSIVSRIAGTAPMSITGNQFVINTGQVEADIVPEAGAKPISKPGVTLKSVTPVKAALIVYWSKEARLKNPAGVLDNLSEQMADAIWRQVDMAVLHGRSAKSGAAIADVEYVNQTANRVELGTATKAQGGLTADLLSGYGTVVDAGYDFSAFAADPRFRTSLMGAVDLQGRPVYQSTVDLRDGMSTTLGLPTAYGKAVSGGIGGNTETAVRAFGGDFAGNLRLGFVEQITMRRSDQATLVDGGETVPLWQHNMEAALVEAIFGWVLHDTDAFVAYENAVADAA